MKNPKFSVAANSTKKPKITFSRLMRGSRLSETHASPAADGPLTTPEPPLAPITTDRANRWLAEPRI